MAAEISRLNVGCQPAASVIVRLRLTIGSGGGPVFDRANDGGQNRPTGAATDELHDDGAGIEFS